MQDKMCRIYDKNLKLVFSTGTQNNVPVHDLKNLHTKYEQGSSNSLQVLNLTSRMDAMVEARQTDEQTNISHSYHAMLKQAYAKSDPITCIFNK